MTNPSSTCDSCGAAVNDLDMHQQWHDKNASKADVEIIIGNVLETIADRQRYNP